MLFTENCPKNWRFNKFSIEENVLFEMQTYTKPKLTRNGQDYHDIFSLVDESKLLSIFLFEISEQLLNFTDKVLSKVFT
jgi:hypothetical protein